jgi:hypothetical protein
MHKFLAILMSVFVTLPAYSAGLGFNPFDRHSPTSAAGSPKPGPSAPSNPPTSKPIPAPVSPIKQDAQAPAKNSPQQNKK